jgi:hypothetical protein
MVVGSGFCIGEGLMWGVMLALARTISAQLPHLSLLVQGGSILLLPLLVTFFQLGILVTQAVFVHVRGQSALFLLLAITLSCSIWHTTTAQAAADAPYASGVEDIDVIVASTRRLITAALAEQLPQLVGLGGLTSDGGDGDAGLTSDGADGDALPLTTLTPAWLMLVAAVGGTAPGPLSGMVAGILLTSSRKFLEVEACFWSAAGRGQCNSGQPPSAGGFSDGSLGLRLDALLSSALGLRLDALLLMASAAGAAVQECVPPAVDCHTVFAVSERLLLQVVQSLREIATAAGLPLPAADGREYEGGSNSSSSSSSSSLKQWRNASEHLAQALRRTDKCLGRRLPCMGRGGEEAEQLNGSMIMDQAKLQQSDDGDDSSGSDGGGSSASSTISLIMIFSSEERCTIVGLWIAALLGRWLACLLLVPLHAAQLLVSCCQQCSRSKQGTRSCVQIAAGGVSQTGPVRRHLTFERSPGADGRIGEE